MCGEQEHVIATLIDDVGSPPRVRGTEKAAWRSRPTLGITPACAGNSSGSIQVVYIDGDHPRVCGEQFIPSLVFTRKIGSPPRVRGTANFLLYPSATGGITPACAGNSPSQTGRILSGRDHPRVCGEQITDTLDGIAGEGSPPRVRGTEGLGRS